MFVFKKANSNNIILIIRRTNFSLARPVSRLTRYILDTRLN